MINKSILLNFLEEEVTPLIEKEVKYIIKEGKLILYPGIIEIALKELNKLGLVDNNTLSPDIKEILNPKNVRENLRG